MVSAHCSFVCLAGKYKPGTLRMNQKVGGARQ